MDLELGPTKLSNTIIKDTKLEDVLSSFPELNNGANGLYNITTLQVIAALSAKEDENLKQKILTCGGDVNQGDQLGRTPLHYAVINGNFELVKLLLHQGADTECKFLYLCSLRTSQQDYSKWNKLYAMLPPPDGWGRTPLHLAVKEGHVDIVKLLIKSKANVNVQDEKGVTPLLLAGGNKDKSAFEEIVQILVETEADVNVKHPITGTTPLFHAVILRSTRAVKILLKGGAWLRKGTCEQTELHAAASNGQLEILKLFLNDPKITIEDINSLDDCGRSPLYKAVLGSHRKCSKLLISSGGSLRNKSKTKETVMDVIFTRISKPSHFLKDILDSKINGNNLEQTNENYRVTLDFSILAPDDYNHQMDIISNILVAANEKEKVHILQHPLIESFLRLKWYKIRQFFFLLIISYAIFVLSLSTYVTLLIHDPEGFPFVINVARYFVIVTAGGLSGHAIIQCTLITRNFLQQYELWLNLFCTILSLILCLANFNYQEDKSNSLSGGELPRVAPNWIVHASSISVLLAWTELMLLIGRFPTYGYYALMFAVVLQNVVKVLLTFICLVIGFALSFSIQFRNYDQFSNPWRALVKTTVMMMGEFEYSDLFDNSEEGPIRLQTTSRIIFLIFIILASIVLMNLMVGLAVSDIQGLQEEGYARRLEKQAEFLRQLERVVSFKFIESRWFPSCLRTFLKRKSAINLKLIVHPEHAVSMGMKYTKKLPCELIESIMTVAQHKNEEQYNILRNIRLPELVEALRDMLRRHEEQ